ncbi:MAG: hypothetical protein KBD50_00795 [Candidatus Pacebacteria bacterium]|nr:hypothetical protein [Candidatus Paceibacterota bacterium]
MTKAPTARRKAATSNPEDLDEVMKELGDGIGHVLKENLDKTNKRVDGLDARVGGMEGTLDTIGADVQKIGTGVTDLRKVVDDFVARPQFPRSAAQALLRGLQESLK